MFNREVLSIDIGSHQIKMATGKYYNGEIIISHAFRVPTPENAYQDGQILDLAKIQYVIDLALEEHQIKAKKVIYSVRSTSVITREVDLPSVEEDQLANMLNYEIQQFFPTSLEEYVIQYKKLKTLEAEGKIRLLVAALPRLIVQNYWELSKALNLKPMALDLQSNSISKLFRKGLEHQDHRERTLAVLDLGYEGININIIKEGILEFSKLLPIGGKDINTTIASVFDIPLEETEDLKMNPTGDYLEEARVANLIDSCIQGWVEEIQRVFKYHSGRELGNRIDEIYLIGGHANLKKITEGMEGYFNIPTHVLEKLSNVKMDLVGGNKETELKYFLNTIGAIIQDFNFFEPYLNSKDKFYGGKAGKYILVAGATILLTLYPLYNVWQINQANRAVATIGVVANSSEILEGRTMMEELVKKREELGKKKQSLEGLETVYREKDIINDLLMDTINAYIPEDVFLQSIRMETEKIQLQGISKDKVSIALLEGNLRKTEEFKDVFISSIIENSGSYTFILSFSIEGGDEE